MFLVPISTFYFTQYAIFGNDNSKLAYSGLLAVFSANIVIFFYIRMAWLEDRNPGSQERAPQKID